MLQDSYGREYMPCPSTIKGCGGCLEASVFFCIWAVWVRKWYVHFFFHVQVCHYSILKHNMVSQFFIAKGACNVPAQDLGALNLWVTAAAILEHVHICALSGVRTYQIQFQFNRATILRGYNKWCVPYTFWHIGCCCDTIQYPWTRETLTRVSDAPPEVTEPNFGWTR